MKKCVINLPVSKGVAFSSGIVTIRGSRVWVNTPEGLCDIKPKVKRMIAGDATINDGIYAFKKRFAIINRHAFFDVSDKFTGLSKLKKHELGKVL